MLWRSGVRRRGRNLVAPDNARTCGPDIYCLAAVEEYDDGLLISETFTRRRDSSRKDHPPRPDLGRR
jgi:hypothetical protein